MQKVYTENIHNSVSKNRDTVIRDSMVKFVKSENLSDENYIANIRTHPGPTTEDITDYVKPIIRRNDEWIGATNQQAEMINLT